MELCQLDQAPLFTAGAECGELERHEEGKEQSGDNSSLLLLGSTSCKEDPPAEVLPFPGAHSTAIHHD